MKLFICMTFILYTSSMLAMTPQDTAALKAIRTTIIESDIKTIQRQLTNTNPNSQQPEKKEQLLTLVQNHLDEHKQLANDTLTVRKRAAKKADGIPFFARMLFIPSIFIITLFDVLDAIYGNQAAYFRITIDACGLISSIYNAYLLLGPENTVSKRVDAEQIVEFLKNIETKDNPDKDVLLTIETHQ